MSEIDYKQLTDEELIAMFQNGDEKAYKELYIRFHDRLLNFIKGFVHDFEISQNLAQDTLVKVWTHKHLYEQKAKFSTWIFTIAGNLAKTELRKTKRRKTYSFSQLSNENNDFDPGKATFHTDTYKEDNTKEEYELVLQAIDRLPEDMKEIMHYRNFQELSYEDISIILDLPIGTVKSRINRARLRTIELVKEIEKEQV